MREAENYNVALKMVKSGKFAFIAEKSYYSAVSASDCDLVMAQEEFYPTDYGWAFPKGTPYIKKFNDR